jgi:MFS family permease
MSGNLPSTTPSLPRHMIWLLSAAVFINYFDRGNLATAAPLLQSDLHLSNAQMGVLFSAFFWSYAPMQPLAGWLAQRYDVRYVLGGGLALWALATLLTGFASGFLQLLVLRALLGIGESVFYPSNSRYLAQRAAAHERGRANGFIAVGQSLGPAVGTLAGGLALAAFGWRATFIVFGALSLLWLWPWNAATRGGVTVMHGDAARPVPYAELLRTRALWGTSLGHFCGNYAFYFLLSWLPSFLVKDQGYGLRQMALLGAGVYLMQALSAPLTGWWCDRSISRGAPANRVLKWAINTGVCMVALVMALCVAARGAQVIALLLVAGLFFGVQSAPLGAITQTLAGPRAAGRWMGIQNFCANLSGIIAPWTAGWLLDVTGRFSMAFLIAAAVTLVGAVAFGIVIRNVAPVPWR